MPYKLNILSLILASAGVLFTSQVGAAIVPAGVKLADKQELVRNNGAELQSLDPHKIEGVPESNATRDLFMGLTTTDQEGHVVPGVAERWEHSEDYKTWTFHIRPNSKWSNGDVLNAHDFLYSFQRLVDPNTASPYGSYLQYGRVANIEAILKGTAKPAELGVKALDDFTLQFTLSESVPYFHKILIHSSMSPVHRATIEKHGDKWPRPETWVSNGPFMLKEHVLNEKIVMVKNPNYWDANNTILEKVTYLPISSETTDVTRYRAGEIDITYNNLPIELYRKLKSDLPNEIKTGPYLCSYYYEFNNARAPMNDARVRTALKYALDQNTIATKIKAQGETPAFGFTPPYTDGAKLTAPEWFNWPMNKRLEEAKRLLTEAGYSTSRPLEVTFLYNNSELHKNIAIAANSMWGKLGGIVKLNIENQEWKTFLDRRHQGNYDIARAGWCADYNEPTTFLNIMQANSSNNTSHYTNPAFDAILNEAIKAKTDEERMASYQKAEELLDKESVIAPIYYYANTRLVKPHVGGYSSANPHGYLYSKDLYIIKK